MALARLDLPTNASPGELVKLRLLVQHPMETGYLLDNANQRVPRNVIVDMRCRYGDHVVFRIEPTSGLSANPYVSFYLRARSTAEVVVDWLDDKGERGQIKRLLQVM